MNSLRNQVRRALKEYDPNQPRVASGSPEGGRWASSGAARMKSFPVSPALRQAADTLARYGFKSYVVGGAVRDFLAGKKPHDFDLTSDATPDEIKAAFKGHVKFDAGGEAHGIVRVEAGGEIFEIATHRLDVATDGKHATVQFTTSIVDDLQRRDLTYNALAYDLGSGKLYGPGDNGDPQGALDDLANKYARLIRDPKKRLEEDWSRGPRFIRIGAKQGGNFDPASFQAIKDAVAAGKYPSPRLSAEKVRDEFFKTLALPTDAADLGLRMWKESGLLYAYIPELRAAENQSQNFHHGDVKVLEHIFRTVAEAKAPPGNYSIFATVAEQAGVSVEDYATGVLRFVMLMHDIGKPATAKEKPLAPGEFSFLRHENVGAEMATTIAKRLKLPNVVTDIIAASVDGHMAVPHPGASGTSVRRWARDISAKFKPTLDSGFDPVEWMFAIRAADWGALGRPAHTTPDDDGEGGDPGFEKFREQIAEGPPQNAKPPIDGASIMRITGMKPGPLMGKIVNAIGAFKDEFPKATEAEIEDEVMRAYNRLKG